jgi:adenine-specific DNA-methyltransferase
MWFTKGDITRFDLDAVRVPQKYPGKRFYKGPRKGEWSGNPLGKNPGDVWEIPNVKSKHPEKTEHPCQFPTALARRFIRALTAEGDLVIDPYLGSGTTAVAALMEGRNFIGGDISPAYFGIANRRLADLSNGNLKFREDIPPREPKSGESVSITPPHFRQHEKSESFLNRN